MALTDITTVRTRGALKAPPVAGAVLDEQITAAIALAVHRMVEICGWTLYSNVASLDDSDPNWTTADPVTGRTDQQKQSDFLDAESYFAIARIEKVSQIGKVTASGTPMSAQMGREVKTFAPKEETADTAQMWELEAYRCLAPYLGASVAIDENGDPPYPSSQLAPVDTNNDPVYVSSGNKKLIFTAVGANN